MKSITNQRGFSIVELLIVAIIIGIIAALAIPSLLASRRAANEASTAANLRTVHGAQLTYFSTVANNRTYGDLADLSTIAGLLDSTWAAVSVVKHTYTFVRVSALMRLSRSAPADAVFGCSIDVVSFL